MAELATIARPYAEALYKACTDQAGVDLLDAWDSGDLLAQLVAQRAGQSLLGAALLHDDGDFLIRIDGQKRTDRAVRNAHQRDNRANGHGHADHGQSRSDSAADHVFQKESV